jgi:hypothetical protein
MLYLYRGHLAWQENQNSIDSVVNEYKISLIYALRYNRFLLDEILNGRPQGTILNPVIPSCMTHGEKGKEILNQLFNWWQKENNEIYERSSHSISPIKRGIGLLAAENFARLNEPGNLIHQTLTSDQIQNALRLFNRAPSC